MKCRLIGIKETTAEEELKEVRLLKFTICPGTKMAELCVFTGHTKDEQKYNICLSHDNDYWVIP